MLFIGYVISQRGYVGTALCESSRKYRSVVGRDLRKAVVDS